MKRLPSTICHICLRSGLKLMQVDYKLESYYADLCDYVDIPRVHFCGECIKRLKNGYQLKNICVTAVKTLMTWARQKPSKTQPLNLLYKELHSYPYLGLSNKKNFKIHLCQSADLESATSFEVSTSKHPNIVTVNIPQPGKKEIPCEIVTEPSEPSTDVLDIIETIKQEEVDFVAFDDSEQILEDDTDIQDKDIFDTKSEILNSDDDIADSGSEYSLSKEKNTEFDSDVSLNQSIENITKYDSEESLGLSKEKITEDASNVSLGLSKEKTAEYDSDVSLNESKEKITEYDSDVSLNESKDKISEYDSDVSLNESKDKITEYDSDVSLSLSKENITEDDSDVSLDNFIAKYLTPVNKKFEDPNNKHVIDNIKRRNAIKNVNVEQLTKSMREKFDKFGIVKDNKGNVIDVNIVLGCIDKLTQTMLRKVKKHCAAKGCFSSKAIDLLTELHDQYSEYEKMGYTIKYIRDDDEIRLEFEKRRVSEQYTEAKFRCDTCFKGFRYEGFWREHMKSRHDASNPLECELCKTRCRSKCVMTEHMREHRRFYKCKNCPFVTSHKYTVINHCNRHAGVQYTCRECGKLFKSRSFLHQHYRRHGANHYCNMCGAACPSSHGLINHRSWKHRDVKFVEGPENKRCDPCDVVFLNDNAYQNHMKVTHLQRSRGLRKVVMMTCTVCGVSGKGPLWLSSHMKTAHPEVPLDTSNHTYLCHTCGKGFSELNKQGYKDHMNTHTGARPHKCPLCPKTFQGLYNMYIHKQRHLPPKFACQECGKKFTSSGSLFSHMRMHIGDRKFKCEFCGKGFLHRSTMNVHVNAVHFNIRRKKKSQS